MTARAVIWPEFRRGAWALAAPVRLRERVGVATTTGRVLRVVVAVPFPFPLSAAVPFPFPVAAAATGAWRVTGGLDREVEDSGALLAAEALDDADLLCPGEAGRNDTVNGIASGLQIAAGLRGRAVAIGQEDALGGIGKIHHAIAGQIQLQALAGGVGVDGVVPLIGDALDDGDNTSLTAHEFGAEAIPGEVITAASHHHVEAHIQAIEGGSDAVAVEQTANRAFKQRGVALNGYHGIIPDCEEGRLPFSPRLSRVHVNAQDAFGCLALLRLSAVSQSWASNLRWAVESFAAEDMVRAGMKAQRDDGGRTVQNRECLCSDKSFLLESYQPVERAPHRRLP